VNTLVESPSAMGPLTRRLYDDFISRRLEGRRKRGRERASCVDLLSGREVLSLHRLMAYLLSAVQSARRNSDVISLGPLHIASIEQDTASLSRHLSRFGSFVIPCPVCGDALLGPSNQGSNYSGSDDNGEEIIVCRGCLSPIELCCQSLLPVEVPGSQQPEGEEGADEAKGIESMVCGACSQYTNVNCGGDVGLLDAHATCLFCCLPLHAP
jgi:hypothetical protein